MTKAPKRCNGYTADLQETEALLKTLEQGNQELSGGKVQPLAHVVNRLKPGAERERTLEQFRAALLVGAASEPGRHVDEHLSQLRATVRERRKEGDNS